MLLLLLLAQETPVIERAELLTGGAFRPGHWAPLQVRVRGVSGRVELIVKTDLGMAVVHEVELGEARPDPVVLALALAIDSPLEVLVRREGAVLARLRRRSLGRGLYQSDRLISSPGEPPDDRTVVCRLDPRRLEWFEAVDAVVGPAPEGYAAMGGLVASDLPEAIRRIEARGKFETRWFEPVDPALCRLAPSGPWIESRRRAVVWFALAYCAVAVVALAAAARWKPKFAWAVALGLGLVGTPGVYLLFPKGTVSVTRRACEIDGAHVEALFVRSSREDSLDVRFASLVKPVYGSYQGATLDTAELRIEGAACRVTGMKLRAGESRVFGAAWAGSRLTRLSEPSREAAPDDPGYRWFRARLMRGDFAFGWRTRKPTPGTGVEAAGLAEIVDEPVLEFLSLGR